jgi:hypothetical protein
LEWQRHFVFELSVFTLRQHPQLQPLGLFLTDNNVLCAYVETLSDIAHLKTLMISIASCDLSSLTHLKRLFLNVTDLKDTLVLPPDLVELCIWSNRDIFSPTLENPMGTKKWECIWPETVKTLTLTDSYFPLTELPQSIRCLTLKCRGKRKTDLNYLHDLQTIILRPSWLEYLTPVCSVTSVKIHGNVDKDVIPYIKQWTKCQKITFLSQRKIPKEFIDYLQCALPFTLIVVKGGNNNIV